jgi:hypothetical protein
MPQKRIPIGEYLPDLPALANPGLTRAHNVVPVQAGVGPQPGFSSYTGYTPLADLVRGGNAFIDRAGNPNNFAGTETELYRMASVGTVNASRLAGGLYNANGFARWEFVNFDNDVVAVNPNDDPQFFDMSTSTNFARLAPQAPRAHHVGIIGNHVVLGNVYDHYYGAGPLPTNIWWCAIRDPFGWPKPGTDDAVNVQSDRQPLEGDGGWVHAVVSGAEVGAIFQERQIWRMDYRGGDVIYELNRVEPLRGLLIPGLAVPFGRMVFYLAEDGFYLFDYTSSTAIGKDKVNTTFFNDWDSAYPHRVWAVADPNETRIYTLYPGTGNTNGIPNRYLCYDWKLNRFTEGSLDADMLVRVLAPGSHLDQAPAEDIDDPVTGLESFDDRQSSPGAMTLGMWDTNHQIGALTGSSLDGFIETGDAELNPGYVSMLDGVRPLMRGGVDPTVQVAARRRYKNEVKFGLSQGIDEDGDAPFRATGRYHRLRLNLSSGWEEAFGLDIEHHVEGVR